MMSNIQMAHPDGNLTNKENPLFSKHDDGLAFHARYLQNVPPRADKCYLNQPPPTKYPEILLPCLQ